MSLLHKKQSLDILGSNNTEFNSQVIIWISLIVIFTRKLNLLYL